MAILDEFQLTCPHEAGTHRFLCRWLSRLVSTHVPARGGHRTKTRSTGSRRRFNSRARTRRALKEWKGKVDLVMFQLTCPHEAGTFKRCMVPCCASDSFNSRARTRRARPTARGRLLDVLVSTHVPARGGHHSVSLYVNWIQRFNSRARTRRAPMSSIHRKCPNWFQLTCPHEAGTTLLMTAHTNSSSFNSRARTRRARRKGDTIFLVILVSTHVPARGGHFYWVIPYQPGSWFQLTCPHEAGTSCQRRRHV